MTYESAVLADIPAFLWMLDETSGTVAVDATGAGVAGTYAGGYTLGVAGPAGVDTFAASFNGRTGLTYQNGLQTSPVAFTLEFWFRAFTPGNAVAGFSDAHGIAVSSTDRQIGLDPSGNLQFFIFDNTLGDVYVTSSGINYADNAWHHAAATYSSATGFMYLYADGVQVASGSGVTNPAVYSGYWLAGNSGDAWFSGSLCAYAVYPAVLSGTQVNTHFAASGPPVPVYAQNVDPPPRMPGWIPGVPGMPQGEMFQAWPYSTTVEAPVLSGFGVLYDAVGPSSSGAAVTSAGATTTLSWTHACGAGANAILVAVVMDDGSNETMTVTCNGTGMTSLGGIDTAGAALPEVNFNQYFQLFLATGGSVHASAGNAIVVTSSSALPAGQDMNGGSLSFSGYTGHGAVVTGASAKTVTVATTGNSNIVAGFCSTGTAITQAAGNATGRFLNNWLTTSTLGCSAAATASATGGNVTITWTGGDATFCTIGLEMQGAAAPPAVAPPVYGYTRAWPAPPHDWWFPGAPGIPGMSPFQVYPQVTDPGNVFTGAPTASAAGAGAVTAKAVQIAGGQAAGTGLSIALPTAPAAYLTGVSASTSTQAGYFTDNNGAPKLWVMAETWNLFVNAGRWAGSGGGATPQADFTTFFSQRSAQGITVTITDPTMGTNSDSSAPFVNGNTWDGISAFVSGGDPATGLNSTFWTRFDAFLATAATYGVTIGFAFDSYNFTAGAAFSTWTDTQCQQYGAALGARYKNTPNLLWLFGNDDVPGGHDAEWSAFLTGIRSAGDTHIAIAWWYSETTSRYECVNNALSAFGSGNSAADFCYTYNASYWVIEYAWKEVSALGRPALLPPFWGDGIFYTGAGPVYFSPDDRRLRQATWWVLTDGGRGVLSEAESIWHWTATAPAAITNSWFLVNNLPVIVSTFTSWTGWHLLTPDLASAFVTAGRGTSVSFSTTEYSGFGNSWVTASITPDGTLACCYLPNATTITVNTALLATGWTASWIDPVSGASSSAGAGPTFNSTAKGSNSQGDPDWVLVFQAPPVVLPAPGLPDWLPVPPGWFPGADRTADLPGGIPFYVVPRPADQNAPAGVTISIATASAAGAGAVTAVATQDAGTSTTAAGAASVTAVATVIAPAAAAGAGAVTALATQIAPATAAGAGAVTDVVTQAATATAAGAGSVTDVVTQIATGTVTGAGAVTDVVTQIAPATAAGAGAVAAVTAQVAGAAAAGAAAVTGVVTQIAPATSPGAAAATDVVTQIATATSAGAGSVTAAGSASGAAVPEAPLLALLPPGWFPGSQAVAVNPGGIPFYPQPQPADQNAPTGTVTFTGTASAAGAGAVTAAVTQDAGTSTSAAGAGAAAAAAMQIAAATATAAGAVTDVVTQIAQATSAGAASVADVVTQIATATAAGAGAVTDVVTEQAIAAAAGTGAVADVVTEIATATAAGAAAASALATQAAIAAVAGTGSATDVVTQIAFAAAAGVASVTAAGGTQGQATGAAAGAAAVTAVATVQAPAGAAGAGAVAALAVQQAPGASAGAAAVNASGYIAGQAGVTGAGAVTTAKSGQAVIATATGAGALSALAVQRAIAALTAAGSVTAAGQSQAAVIKGSSTGTTVTEQAGMSAAVTEAAGMSAAVTAGASSQSGVS